jgi:D-alanyl-D-alanine carboxypeptidase (penicillin-binding protein 5/6)
MTAILALELSQENEIVTVSEKADKTGESSIYLNKGDKIKMSELIEGALVKSGNDACVAIAEHTAGTMDTFVELMNKKALTIGAYNTHFVNPNGLPAKNHYSSAYDLALMARYALQNEKFAELVKTKYASITFDQPPKTEQFKNTNKLLWTYPFSDGVKTGTTNEAGKCLVASAHKDERKLICVVLNAPDRFGDAQRLFNWALRIQSQINIRQEEKN